MTLISDETLMAYADGELDEGDAKAIKDALTEDSGLRERLSRHHALKAEIDLAFGDIIEEPLPERLTDLLKPEAKVFDLSAHRDGSAEQGWHRSLGIVSAMAASLVIGFFAGIGDFGAEQQAPGISPTDRLAEALDGWVSGTGTGDVAVLASFKSADDEFCRHFRLETDAPREGMACKGSDENWSVLALVPVERSDVFRPAGESLPSAVDRLTASMTRLDDKAENELLGR